jgi:enoyl-CoA hydratase
MGLVGAVLPDAELLAHAGQLAGGMCEKSKAGLRGMKYLVNEGLRGNIESGLELEMSYVRDYATTEPDAMEGLVAFKEKRKPRYG